MDVMNLLSGGAVVGTVAQPGSTSTSSTNGAAFQKQLFSFVGAQQGEAANQTDTGQLVASVASLLSKTDGSLNTEQPTVGQLNDLVESLLDQLEELEQVELDGEQISIIESLLGQIEALIQVISLSSDAINHSLSGINGNQLVEGFIEQSSSYNSVVKLQDQMLIVQQALQSGSSKVLSGQSVEAVISEQLQIVQAKVTELLQDVKLKQASAQVDSNSQLFASIAVKDSSAATAEQETHLQRMNQEASYAQAASLVKDSAAASTNAQASNEETSAQPLTSIAMLRADNARELLPHIVRSGPAVTSAFVLADEFADTMKGLIVQRFNVTQLNGLTEARLSLTPEHLGHVDVKISMQNGVLTAMFQTETAMAKDALENQMLQLRASLAAQGITVEKIEVAQSEFASQLSQQQKQNSQGHSSNDSSSSRKEHEETFEEELLLNATNQELGFGRAVNETV